VVEQENNGECALKHASHDDEALDDHGVNPSWSSLKVAGTDSMAIEQQRRQLEGKEPSSTMSEQPETTNPLDPFDTLNTMRDASLKSWQTMRDASLESWSKMMIDLVSSEAYSRATSQWLDTYLTVSQPFQRMLDTTMTQVLTRLNMPMRSDVTSLAERLTNVEMRLDDLDAKLDDIHRAVQALAASKHAADTSTVASIRPANEARASTAAKSGRTQGKAKGVH